MIDFNDPSWDTLVNEISLEEAIAFIKGNGDGLQSISSVGYPSNGRNDGPVGFAYDQVPGYSQKWSASDSGRSNLCIR